MRRFRIVAKQEFLEAVRSTPFKVITVFLLVIVLLMGGAYVLIQTITGTEAEEIGDILIQTDSAEDLYTEVIAIEDRSGMALGKQLAEELPLVRFDTAKLGEPAIKTALDNGECDAYIIINSPLDFICYEKEGMYKESCAIKVAKALERLNSIALLNERGISGTDVNMILDSRAGYELRIMSGGYDMGKYMFNLVMVIMMFLVISLYGQMVANRVATEKSSRTMEVLATSVSPVELLCGKVVGVGAAGLGQILAFFFLSAFMIHGMLSKIGIGQAIFSGVSFTFLDIIWLVLYFVLGFLMVAFVYGGLGSMVSQVEDLSGLVSLPMGVFMIGYFVAITATVTGETNILLKICSFVPFWSPMVMFSRMSVENVPVWQVILSLLLLAGMSALSAALSARLYRTGMLRYGKPPRLREIMEALK